MVLYRPPTFFSIENSPLYDGSDFYSLSRLLVHLQVINFTFVNYQINIRVPVRAYSSRCNYFTLPWTAGKPQTIYK